MGNLSAQGSAEGKNHHGVCPGLLSQRLGCAGVFLEIISTSLKKKEKSSGIVTMEDRKGRFDFMQQQMSPKQ